MVSVQAKGNLIFALILEGQERNLPEKVGGICEQKKINHIILLQTLGKISYSSVHMRIDENSI